MKKNVTDKSNDNVNLSVRASVFLAGLILTVASILSKSSDIPVLFACCAAVLIFWAGAMSFWQRSSTAAFNFLVNTILALGSIVVANAVGADIASGEYIYMMPMIAGITALGTEKGDHDADFRRFEPVNELIIPLVAALAASAPMILLTIVLDHKLISVAVIIAALTLVLLSAVVNLTSGKRVFFSSPLLKDYSSMPAASMDALKGFLFARLAFAIELIPAFIAASLGRYIYSHYLEEDYDIFLPVIPLITAIVFAAELLIADRFLTHDGRRYGRFGVYEAVSAVALISLPFIKTTLFEADGGKLILLYVFYYFSLLIADIIATGYLATFKRRSIFSERPACADGMPLMMIVGGIAIMCVEAVTLL